MATKDYVKRGRAPKKSTRNTRKAPASGGFPFKWALIALCLVSALGYGLYFLSTSPAPEPATAPQPKPAPKPVPKPAPKPAPKPQTSLPPKPEEKWRYIEELENKEVKVEAKQQEKPTRPYLMQCGAYRSADQAEQRKAMIAFQGLTSQIKISQGEKGRWYRVILGPYPQKRKAESDRNQLRRAGIEPCAIWFWE
ncbi:SPOR domain-containing protein [Photobacterium atrarenae]|uniref:SPOR domain-containing protein n=1 Tax=Photobacterium atrarenae TaxID=865757 RepID=A0ABY5GFA6_9GAMM|nr:SPOR domain-containing protein [Photobacterium atrarenae]UTV27934.1 SPOR domain-containing protein [Photobacterium atrarenae]